MEGPEREKKEPWHQQKRELLVVLAQDCCHGKKRTRKTNDSQ